MKRELIDARDAVIKDIESSLLGPAHGEEEILYSVPHYRYPSGVLFPADADALKEDVADEADAQNGGRDENVDPDIAAAYSPLPSSMGISFLLRQTKQIQVHAWGARYMKQKAEPSVEEDERPDSRKRSGKPWKRKSLGSKKEPDTVTISIPGPGYPSVSRHPVLDGTSEIIAYFRSWEDGHLVSITLANRLKPKGRTVKSSTEDILLQCGFQVET